MGIYKMNKTKIYGRKLYLALKYHTFWLPSRKTFIAGQREGFSFIKVLDIWIHDLIWKLTSLYQDIPFWVPTNGRCLDINKNTFM